MGKQGGNILTDWADMDLKTCLLKPDQAKKAMCSWIYITTSNLTFCIKNLQRKWGKGDDRLLTKTPAKTLISNIISYLSKECQQL